MNNEENFALNSIEFLNSVLFFFSTLTKILNKAMTLIYSIQDEYFKRISQKYIIINFQMNQSKLEEKNKREKEKKKKKKRRIS